MDKITCGRCDLGFDSEEQTDSIDETGYCLSCISESGYCEEHNEYMFESEDIVSIRECNMCKECADNWFGGPQSDDPDFMDSYDPDRD